MKEKIYKPSLAYTILFIFIWGLVSFFLLIGTLNTETQWFGVIFSIIVVCVSINTIFKYFTERLVITDDKITKKVWGLLGEDRIDIPLSQVNSITVKKGSFGLVGKLFVLTGNGVQGIIFDKLDNAESVSNYIYQALNVYKTPKPIIERVSNVPSKTDMIREYKKLLDENAITKEEFETKKQELLK